MITENFELLRRLNRQQQMIDLLQHESDLLDAESILPSVFSLNT